MVPGGRYSTMSVTASGNGIAHIEVFGVVGAPLASYARTISNYEVGVHAGATGTLPINYFGPAGAMTFAGRTVTPHLGLPIQLSGLPRRLRHGQHRLKLSVSSLSTPLPRALVTLSDKSRQLHAVADARGRVAFKVKLPRGKLKITVTFPGARRSPRRSEQADLPVPSAGRERRPGGVARLELEQRPLALQATAVAGQRTVETDHPVAGHDDRDRVGSVGRADRAGCYPPFALVAEPLGERPVGRGRPVGNPRKLGPHAALERRPARPQGEIKRTVIAGEIRLQLFDCPPEVLGSLIGLGVDRTAARKP